MQRTLLIALATAVVAAGIATGATILLSDNDELAVSSPSVTAALSPSPEATTSVTTTTATPGTTASAATSSPRPTSTATSRTPAPTPTPPGPTMRPLPSIDCSDEPVYCSSTTGAMTVTDDRLESISSSTTNTSYSGRPTIKMTSKALRPDDKTASKGDDVKMLHVEVVIRNDTTKTFVFPERVVGLDVLRNGRLDERLDTQGDGFEMPPGGEMRAKFDKPIVRDGDYGWQAKTWYYTKS